MSYLDTQWYYSRRKKEVDYRLLQRAYYEGCPYTSPPTTTQEVMDNHWNLWVQIMHPNDSDSPPTYLENAVKDKIDNLITKVFPQGTKIVFNNLPDSMRDPLFDKLLNFAGNYPSGEKGLREWLNTILCDIAQTGDGLPIMLAVPGIEESRVMFLFFPYEAWDIEVDEYGVPKMMRLEYRTKDDEGEESIVRVDIYRDHIVRYSGKPFVPSQDSGEVPPDRKPVDITLFGYNTPEKLYAQPVDAEEAALMRRLDRWIATPLIWDRKSADDLRGSPECSINDLAAADDINRLLTHWKVGAIEVGSPPLFLRDLDLPEEPGGERQELSQSDVGPGSVLRVTSADFERPGEAFYPSNLPTTFPHSEVLERIRHAINAGSPLANIDPAQIPRFGELSAFAKQTLEEVTTQRVAQIRDRVLSTRIAELLQTGIRLLAIKGAVPGLDMPTARKITITFEFAGQTLSADEELKKVTSASMMQKLGIPNNEIIDCGILPFDWTDRQAVIDAMDEQQEAQEEMQEALTAFKTSGQKAEGEEDETEPERPGGDAPRGTDKRGL